MELVELSNGLQSVAHEGYALHDIEIHTKCHGCLSDITIENPELEIIRDEKTKTIKLRFTPKSL